VAAGDAGEGTTTVIPTVSLGAASFVGAVVVAPNGTIQVGDSAFVIGGLTGVTVNLGMNTGLMSGTTPVPDGPLPRRPINGPTGCFFIKCPKTPCSGSRFVPPSGGYPYENPGLLVGCPGISDCEPQVTGTCGVANGRGVCAGNGTCALSVCNASYTNCGGVCDNLTSDANNCGACGNACPTSQVCADASTVNGAVCSSSNPVIEGSMSPIPVGGWATTNHQGLAFQAHDWTSGFMDPITNTPVAFIGASPATWSTSVTLAADNWAPQSVAIGGASYQFLGLSTSIGRAEITAGPLGSGYAVVNDANCGSDAGAGPACSDGTLVGIYPYGVGSAPPNDNTWGAWQPVETVTGARPGVTWQVGYYTVEATGTNPMGKRIYGILCHPTAAPPAGQPYNAMIINNGGFNLGGVDFDGAVDLDLNNCLNFAQANWVVAMSAYRGEEICNVDTSDPPKCSTQLTGLNGPGGGAFYRSDGEQEFCLGEVIDALQLTSMLASYPTASSPWVDPTKMLMWGYSHGGCITLRAVEAGAQVAAAATLDAPTNFAAWSNYCDPCVNFENGENTCAQTQGDVVGINAIPLSAPADGGAPDAAAPDAGTFYCEAPEPMDGGLGCGLVQNPLSDSPYYCVYPGPPGSTAGVSAQGVSLSRVPYDWRSPVMYAGDLAARGNVKMLLLQGGSDALIEPSQACELAARAEPFASVHVTGANDPSQITAFGTWVTAVPPPGADPFPGAPTGCDPSKVANHSLPQYQLQWQLQGFNPIGSWTARRHLVVIDNADHDTIITGLGSAVFLDWLAYAFK
jgi:hypothetical protein